MTSIQTYTEQSARKALLADSYCRKIGAALRKAYPNRNWYVNVNMDGGIAGIHEATISMRYGYTLKLTSNIEQLERRAVYGGGEILERFCLSRQRFGSNDTSHIQRNAVGEAVLAKSGGF